MSFVPLEYYQFFYYQIMLVVCFLMFFHTLVLKSNDERLKAINGFMSLFLLAFLVPYMGLRPISGRYFADMSTYAQTFQQFKYGAQTVSTSGDMGFEYFIFFCTKTMSVEMFFVVCVCIYILPLLKASLNWFPKNYFFCFLFLVASMSFWTYGVNGIRNGMATSLFVLALSYLEKNKGLSILFFLVSLMFHKSMALPLLAVGISFFLTDTKKYYFFWGLSIVLSLAMGGIWENLFASLGFGDDRFANYLTAGGSSKQFSSTGFRFDFLIYSAAPLALAYQYVFVKGFQDKTYLRILHVYMVANAFWIMVIRANFSNRFAYLSWFLMAIVVCYPLLKDPDLFPKQFKRLGITLMAYYGFSYLMFYYFEYR